MLSLLSRKIVLVIFLGITALASFGAYDSAAAAARPKVAVLISYDGAASQGVLKGLKAYLKQQETRVDYDLYPLKKDAAKATAAMRQVRQQGADLILALGSLALEAACRENREIPVIVSMMVDLKDLKKCSAATGVSLDFSLEAQLEWLQRFLPKTKTIGVLYNPAENSEKIERARDVAKKLKLRLEAREVSTPKDLPAALDSLANSADVLLGINDRLVLNPKTAKSILLFSFRNRIPFVGLSSAWVKAGAFYALDRDYADIGRQCGEMIHKALGGTAVGSIAAARPRKVNYSLNLRTAKQMKVKIAKSLVKGAIKTY